MLRIVWNHFHAPPYQVHQELGPSIHRSDMRSLGARSLNCPMYKLPKRSIQHPQTHLILEQLGSRYYALQTFRANLASTLLRPWPQTNFLRTSINILIQSWNLRFSFSPNRMTRMLGSASVSRSLSLSSKVLLMSIRPSVPEMERPPALFSVSGIQKF